MVDTTHSPVADLDDVPMDKRPRHIAIIMDGNGRSARAACRALKGTAAAWPACVGRRRERHGLTSTN